MGIAAGQAVHFDKSVNNAGAGAGAPLCQQHPLAASVNRQPFTDVGRRRVQGRSQTRTCSNHMSAHAHAPPQRPRDGTSGRRKPGVCCALTQAALGFGPVAATCFCPLSPHHFPLRKMTNSPTLGLREHLVYSRESDSTGRTAAGRRGFGEPRLSHGSSGTVGDTHRPRADTQLERTRLLEAGTFVLSRAWHSAVAPAVGGCLRPRDDLQFLR